MSWGNGYSRSWLESGNASSRTRIGLGVYRTIGRGDGCISRTLTRERYGKQFFGWQNQEQRAHDCRRISDSIDRTEACHASSGCLHALHGEGKFGRRRRLTVAGSNRGPQSPAGKQAARVPLRNSKLYASGYAAQRCSLSLPVNRTIGTHALLIPKVGKPAKGPSSRSA